MRVYPYRPSFYFLFFCYAAGVLWGLAADGTAGPVLGRLSVAVPWDGPWMAAFGFSGLLLSGILCFARRPAVRAVAAVLLAAGGGYVNVALGRSAGGRLPDACLDGRKRMYDVEVADFGKATAKSWKKTVRVSAYCETEGEWVAIRATWCLYFQKDSAAASLAPGDRLTVYAAPTPIDAAVYAGYARSMRRRYIYESAYVPRSAWQLVETAAGDGVATGGWSGRHPAHRLRRAAGRLQARLTAGLSHPRLNERERGIAKALVFGDKSDMDPEVHQAYRHAGVVHVLCVSGMHLGILSCLLLLLLKGLRGHAGRWIRFGIVSLFLWGYALVTGLSASVCRAACMLTFVQAGLCFGRRLPIERSLVLSAWLLLLIRPEWLLELGFLLSYMAVGGIVFLQPKAYPAVVEKHKLLKKIVAMSAISWAAQCATGPLSGYSFGQFPVYFWVANLLVAPLASVLLPVGLVTGLAGLTGMPAAGTGWLTVGLAAILQGGIAWMNDMSLWIERWPGAILPVTLSGFACLCCYGLLYCGRMAVVRREKRYWPYVGGLIWLMCCLA